MFKKVLSVVVSLALVLCLLPAGALPVLAETSGDYTYTVENGVATITGYTGAGGDVVIPSTLSGYPVVSIGYSAFEYCDDLTSITIPDGVTSVGGWAFHLCSSLTSITIPDSVTSIGQDAFNACESLVSILLPNRLTSISDSAFYGCSSLISLTIPNSVTSIEAYAFYECNNLVSVVIPNSVTSIGDWAFVGCSTLTSITIPKNVMSVGECAFAYCDSLQQITVDADNPYYCSTQNCLIEKSSKMLIAGTNASVIPADGSVTGIGPSAFVCLKNLDSITIPECVTYIAMDAFYRCTGLQSIEVAPNNSYYCAAENCLVEIASKTLILGCGNSVIPTDGSVTCIGMSAFEGCSSLTSIVIPDSVTNIESSAFFDCSALASVKISNGLESIGDCAFRDCTALVSITIPNSVVSIGYSAFDACERLTDVWYDGSEVDRAEVYVGSDNEELLCATWHYAEYVPTINYTVADGEATITGYIGASRDVVIPDLIDGYPVTSIGDFAFFKCGSIVSVTIPNSVIHIGESAFYDCRNLVSVTLPNSVAEIGADAFRSCSSLTSIAIPDNLTNINSFVFYGCSSLTSITIPDGVMSIGADAFRSCSNLATVTIGNGVTSIESYAFSNCSNLVSVTIPNSVTSIESFAFSDCINLASITIPNSLTRIAAKTFSGCSSLTSITIPNSVTWVFQGAFSGCSNLVDVWYNGTETEKAAMWFTTDNDNLVNATWHYAGEPNNPSEPDEPVIDENAPQFVVEDVTAKAGDTVTVAVKVKNNPGIVSTKLEIGYDANVLELISGEWQDFTDGVSGFSPTTVNPFVVNWANTLSGNNATDGVLALLTFKVKDGAVAGDTVITVSYDPDDVYDENWDNVSFATVAGTVTVIEYISGDANDDGKVNNKDLGLLLQYLNKWDVTVVEAACDVNRDGKVNNKDLGLLLQYLNGWNVELK